MSDRRPSKPELWKWKSVGHNGDRPLFVPEPATSTDLIAAVRAGVESGTIKGGEGWLCNSALAPRCTEDSHADVVAMFGGHSSCQRALVIPVSDGGSET